MRDPCEAALAFAPHVTAAGGWLWTQQNPPDDVDEQLSGKWMLFPTCKEAVATWRVVVVAVLAGDIWSAKIAPRASSNGHLICVYTPDFTNHPEVLASATLLDNHGLVRRRIYYKPDIFTYAGIYRVWDQRASIYEYVAGESRIRTTPALSRARELLANQSLS
jgi:hypothetical protein